jgi:hypothetical protein
MVGAQGAVFECEGKGTLLGAIIARIAVWLVCCCFCRWPPTVVFECILAVLAFYVFYRSVDLS